jgi:hypothetical protein
MTRNLKALGLVLFAMCAFGAVAVSAASAAVTTDVFRTEGAVPAVITGEGETTFSTKIKPALQITCNGTYTGTIKDAAASATFTPTYDNCKPVGTVIDTNGCNFIIYGETTDTLMTDGVTKEKHAPGTVECPTGKHIEITSACNITITSDNQILKDPADKLDGITFDTEGTAKTRDIKLTVTVDGITYDTPDSLGCTAAGLPREGSDGTLTGSITAKGFGDTGGHTHSGVQLGIFDEDIGTD